MSIAHNHIIQTLIDITVITFKYYPKRVTVASWINHTTMDKAAKKSGLVLHQLSKKINFVRVWDLRAKLKFLFSGHQKAK